MERKQTRARPVWAALAGIGLSALIIGATVPIEQNQVSRDTPELGPVALTAAAGARTFTIPVRGRSEVTIYVDYDRGGTGAATALTMVCLAGPAGDISYKVAILTAGPEVGTSDGQQHKLRWPVTSSDNPRWMIGPLNDDQLSCTIGSEGAVTADDVITTVKTRLGVL